MGISGVLVFAVHSRTSTRSCRPPRRGASLPRHTNTSQISHTLAIRTIYIPLASNLRFFSTRPATNIKLPVSAKDPSPRIRAWCTLFLHPLSSFSHPSSSWTLAKSRPMPRHGAAKLASFPAAGECHFRIRRLARALRKSRGKAREKRRTRRAEVNKTKGWKGGWRACMRREGGFDGSGQARRARKTRELARELAGPRTKAWLELFLIVSLLHLLPPSRAIQASSFPPGRPPRGPITLLSRPS